MSSPDPIDADTIDIYTVGSEFFHLKNESD
jgi:hypothetical protein